MLLIIEGMGCMHCVKKVTAALEGAGASVKKVEIGSAEIEPFEDVSLLKAAIEKAGFTLASAE